MQNAESSPLHILVWVEAQLEAALQTAGALTQASAAIEAAASRKLSEMGLPAAPQVSIQAGIPGEHQAALLALQVNGQTLPSVPGMENRLLAVLLGRLLSPGESGPSIPGWLIAAFQQAKPDSRQMAIQYLGMLSQAILGEHPEHLLDDSQVRLLQGRWAGEIPAITRLKLPWLKHVLQELLAVRLPVSGDSRLLQLLLERRHADKLEAAEAAITALIPPTIGLSIPRHLLRSYTQEDVRLPAGSLPALGQSAPISLSASAFSQMGQQIFAGLGLNLPPLEFEVSDDTLQGFSFRINGLQSQHYPALPPGKVLVDAAPHTLEMMNIAAQAVLHPLDGRLCCLVSLGDETPLAEQGYLTWTGIEYLALCLGHALRAHPACLVHSQSLKVWLEEIEKNASDLVKATRLAYSDGYAQSILISTLRSLARQAVSMNELPRILEALLQPNWVAIPAAGWTVVADAMPVAHPPDPPAWRSDPEKLAQFARWSLALPAISITPGGYANAGGPSDLASLEQYAEPLTQEQRIAELARRYTNEDIQHYLTFIAVALVITQQTDLPEFVNQKLEELFARLEITGETPPDQMLTAITNYFTQNPVNPQLVQESTAAIRAEVPANADAFTIRWSSKYAA